MECVSKFFTMANFHEPDAFDKQLKKKRKKFMRSDTVKKGYEKAPHRALLRATGLQDDDFKKPFVAIVNSYVDIVPGHVHLQDFGKLVKDAVREAAAYGEVIHL